MKTRFKHPLIALLSFAATALFCLNCRAQSVVNFSVVQFTGTTNDTVINIRAQNNPVIYNGSYYWMPANGTNLATTNGFATVSLIPSHYTVSLAGLPQSWNITVTNSASALNAANLTTGTIIYNGINGLTGPGAAYLGNGIWNIPAGSVTAAAVLAAVPGIITNATFLIASQNGCKFGTNDDTQPERAMHMRALTNSIYILQDGNSMCYGTVTNYGNTTFSAAASGDGLTLATNVNDFLYVTPLNGDVFTCSNIAIEGITFNCNGLNQFMGEAITNTSPHFLPITNGDGTIFSTVHGPAGFSEYNFAVWFNSCANLTLKNVTVLDAPCFGITFGGMVSNVMVDNFTASWSTNWNDNGHLANFSNHDGFHVYGNSWNVTVNGLYVNNNDDDWLALGGNEFSASAMTNATQGYYAKNWTNSAVYPCRGTNQGLMFNTTVNGIFVTGTNGAGLHVYEIATNNDFIGNTKISNVHGTTYNVDGTIHGYFHCLGHPFGFPVYFDNLDLEDIYMDGGPYQAGFFLWYMSGTNVTIRNFNTASEPMGNFSGDTSREAYVWQNGLIQNIHLENFNLNIPNNASSKSNSIFLGGYASPQNSTLFMRGMSVSDPSGWFRSPIITDGPYYLNTVFGDNYFPSTTASNLFDSSGYTPEVNAYSPLTINNGTGNGGGLTNYSVGNLATNNANAAPTSGTPYLEWTTASGWEFGPGGSGGSGGITQLTGDVTAGPGTGSQAATVVQVGGYSAANVASGATAGNAATSANTPSTIIARDGSGNFSAGTISATFTGNGVFTSTTNTGSFTVHGVINVGTFTNNGNVGISGTLSEAGAATIAGSAAIGGPIVGLGNSNYLSGALTVGGNQTNALAQTNLVSDGAPTGYFPTLYAGAANLTGTLPTGTLPASVPTSVTYNANGTSGGGASIAANVLTITAPTPSGSGSFTPLNTGGFTNTTSGQIITNQEATALNSLYVGGSDTNEGAFWAMGSLNFFQNSATFAANVLIDGPLVANGNSNVLTGSLYVGGNQTNALAQTNLVSDGAPTGYFPTLYAGAANLTGTIPTGTLPTSVPTSVTYNANGTSGGGVSIAANVLTVTEPTPGGGGSATIPTNNLAYVRPETFGAKADGSTDSTLAISNADAYLASIGGGVLQFSNGIYVISEPFTLHKRASDGKVNTIWAGLGSDTTLFDITYTTGASNFAAFEGLPNGNFECKDIGFYGVTTNCFLFTGTQPNIHDCASCQPGGNFTNFVVLGLDDSADQFQGYVARFWNNDTYSGGALLGQSGVNGSKIEGNHIHGGMGVWPSAGRLYSYSIAIINTNGTPEYSDYNNILNNTFEGNVATNPIILQGTAADIVAFNHVDDQQPQMTAFIYFGTNTEKCVSMFNWSKDDISPLYIDLARVELDGANWTGNDHFERDTDGGIITGPFSSLTTSNIFATGSVYANNVTATNALIAGTLTGNGIGITNLQGSAFAITNPAATTVTNYTVNIGAGPVMYINPGANNVCLKNILGTFGTVRVYVTGPVKILWPTNCPTFFSSLLTINNTNYVLQGTNLTCIQFDAITNLTQNASLTNVPVSWLSE